MRADRAAGSATGTGTCYAARGERVASWRRASNALIQYPVFPNAVLRCVRADGAGGPPAGRPHRQRRAEQRRAAAPHRQQHRHGRPASGRGSGGRGAGRARAQSGRRPVSRSRRHGGGDGGGGNGDSQSVDGRRRRSVRGALVFECVLARAGRGLEPVGWSAVVERTVPGLRAAAGPLAVAVQRDGAGGRIEVSDLLDNL